MRNLPTAVAGGALHPRVIPSAASLGLQYDPEHGELDERGALRYRSRVEIGITDDVREALQERLLSLARKTSPFAVRLAEPDAVYVEPLVPAEIRYVEVTSAGRLRHPAFRQLGGRWNH